MGDFKSFKIGFNKYRKLFKEGNPNVFIVSNFFRANDIFVSFNSYFRSNFDSYYKKLRSSYCKWTDTFWIRSDVENADGMLFIAFL